MSSNILNWSSLLWKWRDIKMGISYGSILTKFNNSYKKFIYVVIKVYISKDNILYHRNYC